MTAVGSMTRSWSEAKEELDAATLYLVHRTGPTVYQIKDEAEHSFRVILGDRHSCSCRGQGFCMHLLFVLLKVLRIPVSNHLATKTGFTDAETDVALSGQFEERCRPKHKQYLRAKKKTETNSFGEAEEEGTVERQVLSANVEEICPICQDEMSFDQALTWCRKGCGNNIHAKCMKMYAQYKTTTKKDILCPLCRESWGPMAIHMINEDCEFLYLLTLTFIRIIILLIFLLGKGKASLKKSCANVTCSTCSCLVKGDFVRCVECSIYGNCKPPESGDSVLVNDQPTPVDFCMSCFKSVNRMHAKHHFLTSAANATLRDFCWEFIKNPRAPQQSVSSNLVEELQNRELTTDDYNLLLELDRPQHITLEDTIINALRCCKNADKCWCGTDTNGDNAKALSCGHAVHVKCCTEILNVVAQEGFWKLEGVKCQHVDCGIPIFDGLARRRKKPKKDTCATTSCDKVTLIQEPNAALFSTSISINGSRIGTGTNDVDNSSQSILSSVRSESARSDRGRNMSCPLIRRETSDISLAIESRTRRPPQSSPTVVTRQGSRKTDGRMRGLVLSGHSRMKCSINGATVNTNNGEVGTHSESIGTARSSTATAKALCRGTSSFARASAISRKRDKPRQSEAPYLEQSEIDGIFRVIPSLARGSNENATSESSSCQPDRLRRQNSKKGHVARIRGLAAQSLNIEQSRERGEIRTCLTINNI